jgi:DNA-binding HxlR family transcriptional regulator
MSATNTSVRTGTQCVAVNEAVALLHDKWTLLVLGALAHSTSLRYRELQRAVIGISQRMLTLTLKRLTANGLVKRTMFATVPPRVDYELTALGRSLNAPLKALLNWSLANHAAMAEARRAYGPASSVNGRRAVHRGR